MWQHLTPELIFEVLGYFLPGLKLVVCAPAFFPWYLGHICSAWRTVFMTSPHFWSTVRIDFDHDRSRKDWLSTKEAPAIVDRALELVEICTERGRNFPLSLEYITGIKGADNLDPSRCLLPRYAKILDILVAQSTRWRQVRLVVDARELQTLHEAGGRFPNLQALQLLVTGDNTSPPFTDLFDHAPHLSRISLSNISAWHPTWSTMKAIEIRTPGAVRFHEIIDALRETRCLEQLILYQPFDISSMLDDITPVVLPFLETLYTDGAVTLPFIIAPALQVLWIHNGYNNFEKFYSKESFHRHISSFFKPVQRLRFLMLAPWDTKDARIILSSMPKVDHLCFVTRLLSVLDCLTTSCPNAPYLEQLSFQLTNFSRHSLNAAGAIFTTLVKNSHGSIRRLDVVSTKVSMVGNSPGDIKEPSFLELRRNCEALGTQFTASSIWAGEDDLVRKFDSAIITV